MKHLVITSYSKQVNSPTVALLRDMPALDSDVMFYHLLSSKVAWNGHIWHCGSFKKNHCHVYSITIHDLFYST